MATREFKTDVIVPPAAPPVPGLNFRRFRGEEDYPHMLAAINAGKLADEIERSDTLEDIARNYSLLHNCDPYEDMIFPEVYGNAIGYGRVWWEINSDGEWLGFSLAFLHPDWRRKGIGTAILRHNERRLLEIAGELEAEGTIQPSTPRFIEVWASDTETGTEALVLKEGFKPVRYAFSMTRPLSEPVDVTPMPDSPESEKSGNGASARALEIRNVPPEHYRTVWDAMQEAFQDHWSYVPEPEEEYQKWLKWPDFNPSIWKVAWDGDQVAGMVLNFVAENENKEYNRKRGYTEAICVRRPWRRRGLAKALLTRSLLMFQEMGFEEAALGVDTENLSGALNLYESVGFRVEKRHTTYRKAL
jgi:ribosomal protein S18 acetylase RimI-like enzyme